MTKAYAYASVGVEIQVFDETGALTSSTPVKVNDKITDLEVYSKEGKKIKITGQIVKMDIVPNPAKNPVPHSCYHHNGAIIDTVPIQNREVHVATLFTTNSDEFYVPMIVVKDLESEFYYYVQTNSIISVGSVAQMIHTVGAEGDFTDIATALSEAAPGDVLMVGGLKETAVTNIAVGSDITIDGQGDAKFVQFKIGATGDVPTKVTLKNLTMDGSAQTTTYGILFQNQEATGQCDVDLTLENVTFTAFKSKGIYLTNAKKVTIRNCTFDNVASGEMDDPNTRGDYGIDMNVVSGQDCVITIENCKFTGDCGKKSPISIKARCGASDADASDMPKDVPEATIESVKISGCDFAVNACEATYTLGSTSKTAGDVKNTTGAYAVSLSGNSAMTVKLAYKEPKDATEEKKAPIVSVPANGSATKEADGDLVVGSDMMFTGKGANDSVYTF